MNCNLISYLNIVYEQLKILCVLGIAEGSVFCGLVGSKTRCEYAMMGGSVNLAARLMGKADIGRILVSESVYLSSHRDFVFNSLPPVQAKGYVDPVPVFEPVNRRFASDINKKLLTKFIGREAELQYLKDQVNIFMKESVEKKDVNIAGFNMISAPPVGKNSIILIILQ